MENFEGLNEHEALIAAVNELTDLAAYLHIRLLQTLNGVTEPGEPDSVIEQINFRFQEIYDQFSGEAQNYLTYVFEVLNTDFAAKRTSIIT